MRLGWCRLTTMNMKMVYNEWYGELPSGLLTLVKRNNVSPSDYRALEGENLTWEQMADAIRRFSPNGNFQVFSFLMSPASL